MPSSSPAAPSVVEVWVVEVWAVAVFVLRLMPESLPHLALFGGHAECTVCLCIRNMGVLQSALDGTVAGDLSIDDASAPALLAGAWCAGAGAPGSQGPPHGTGISTCPTGRTVGVMLVSEKLTLAALLDAHLSYRVHSLAQHLVR